MPKNSIISEGNTTNEAIEKGLKILNVSKNMVNIKILENEQKRSFFSILAPRVVKVELTLKEEKEEHKESSSAKHKTKREKQQVSTEKIEKAEKNVKAFLDELLTKLGNDTKYEIIKDEYGLEVSIEGADAVVLIGYRGETLYALQTLLSSIAGKGLDEKIRVVLDIGNYKEKREKTLENLALKIAKSVEKTGKPVKLEPMQAYERKIIHSALQESKTVKTESIGEEPRRRVVISLK